MDEHSLRDLDYGIVQLSTILFRDTRMEWDIVPGHQVCVNDYGNTRVQCGAVSPWGDKLFGDREVRHVL